VNEVEEKKLRRIKCRSGQGLVEYILIIALIAIVAIAGLKFFGGKIKSLFTKAGQTIEKEAGSAMDQSKSESSSGGDISGGQ
jgi:pilus assembly protein Flp/PilA